MNQYEPQIARLTPFKGDGGALAGITLAFGPILVETKLYQSSNGYFLSFPSRRSEAQDKWYDQVHICDYGLRMQAQNLAIQEYERLSQGELVAV